MSKVVSETDIGSANPIAKFFRELKNSFKGILTGILLIVISFVLVYFMVTQKKHSATVGELTAQTPAEAEGNSGLVMIQGEPTYDLLVNEPRSGEDVLYYSYTKEEEAYREVKKSEVIERDGRQIRQETVEYELQWRPVEGAGETEWSEFSLGNIKINPVTAKKEFNSETLYSNQEELEYNSFLSPEQLVGVPQRTREKVVGVTSDTQLVVVGELSGDQIASGGGEEGTFIVSNKNPAQLQSDLEKSEKTTFWIMAIAAWLLMANGFTMLFGPITHVMNIIPGLGELTKGLLFFIFAIISAIIVFIAYIGFKFWWVLSLVVVGFFAFEIAQKLKKGDVKGAKKPEKTEKKEEKKEEKTDEEK